MRLTITDGGRAAAGFRGKTRDCVVRSVAIASGRSYKVVYKEIFKLSGETPRSGVRTKARWFKEYMKSLGFEWRACMGIGTGCRVHLREGELPSQGRLVVSCSRHVTAVIDGVIHDVFNPARRGQRCVYGYWWWGG